MKQTVYISEFRDSFIRMGRRDQFSYEALGLIYDYIEEYEQSTGEETELDVIGICCEWAEDTPENIAASYGMDLNGIEGAKLLMHVYEYLNDETQVAGVTDENTIVYVQF